MIFHILVKLQANLKHLMFQLDCFIFRVIQIRFC